MERLTYKSSCGDYGSLKEYETDRDEIQALRNALGRFEDEAEQKENNNRMENAN